MAVKPALRDWCSEPHQVFDPDCSACVTIRDRRDAKHIESAFKVAAEWESGTWLSRNDHLRRSCVTCGEGKHCYVLAERDRLAALVREIQRLRAETARQKGAA